MSIKPDPILYEPIHRKLGCYDCRFADRSCLGKSACCDHPRPAEVMCTPAGTCDGFKPRRLVGARDD